MAIGARLCAVATADRADLMLWQSPATRLIKRRALQRGLRLAHYAHVMRGWHPAHNLANLSPGSIFVLGERDPFIPPRRSARLLQAIERFAPKARVFKLAAGHVKTMLSSATHQYAMASRSHEPGGCRYRCDFHGFSRKAPDQFETSHRLKKVE